MIPPSIANHPKLIELEAKLRKDFAAELGNEKLKDVAELRICKALIEVEVSLLNELPCQGEVLW